MWKSIFLKYNRLFSLDLRADFREYAENGFFRIFYWI
jgi:hypothetical protein